MPVHPSEPNQVFMSSEAACILGLSPTRIQNLTSGRNLQVRPSIIAHGIGTRNMYSRTDLYRLAIASQLNKDGFTAQWIQTVMDRLQPAFEKSELAIVLVIPDKDCALWATKSQVHVQLIPKAHFERRRWHVLAEPFTKSFGYYLLNIAAIVEEVDGRVESFTRGEISKPIKPRAARPARKDNAAAQASQDFFVVGRKVRE